MLPQSFVDQRLMTRVFRKKQSGGAPRLRRFLPKRAARFGSYVLLVIAAAMRLSAAMSAAAAMSGRFVRCAGMGLRGMFCTRCAGTLHRCMACGRTRAAGMITRSIAARLASAGVI